MPVNFLETSLQGVIRVEPPVFQDPRGYFLETYHQKKYADAGIRERFVQDNHSHSQQGTLRGLHYQLGHAQGKLVYVIIGEIFDVAVDIRKTSPTFGQWVGVILSAENHQQLYIPKGFAHGFCVLSRTADVIYKCTDIYAPKEERGIHWADPEIDIDWPIETPILSDKDNRNPILSDVAEKDLPEF